MNSLFDEFNKLVWIAVIMISSITTRIIQIRESGSGKESEIPVDISILLDSLRSSIVPDPVRAQTKAK